MGCYYANSHGEAFLREKGGQHFLWVFFFNLSWYVKIQNYKYHTWKIPEKNRLGYNYLVLPAIKCLHLLCSPVESMITESSNG